MAVTVLLNAKAGSVGPDAEARIREVRELLEQAGVTATVTACGRLP